jgi:hypothetical protein
VLVPLLTPVPPYCGAIIVACQVPVVIVPKVVIVVAPEELNPPILDNAVAGSVTSDKLLDLTRKVVA